MGNEEKVRRVAYIDWMRGLACLLMFQAHGYDSWLAPTARRTTLFMWSQLGGTLPAPLFLFLAGISVALVTDKLRNRAVPAGDVARTTLRRGAEIFALGLLFRIQQFGFNWRWARWSDLGLVDILNNIGLSLMLMGLVTWLAARIAGTTSGAPGRASFAGRSRAVSVGLAAAVALGISLATPPLWTTFRPHWLPWPLESYVNGVHIFAAPKGYFFPIFPWTGFAFAGLAFGFVILSDWAKRHETLLFPLLGVLGVGLVALGRWVDHWPRQFYESYSFWTTSPEFFLIRVGLLLLTLFVAYVWCRWGAAQLGFSPMMQLGKTSLLVYWVHIEFVYGRMIILPSHANSIRVATFGLIFITLFMLVLSLLRTNWKSSQPAIRPAHLAATGGKSLC